MPHAKRTSTTGDLRCSKEVRQQTYSLRDTHNTKRHILVIGAGVSGILLAHHFQKYLSESYTFSIIEKNHDVGGTWLENKYPGCACDVPSEIYQYSFAPTKAWSNVFASSGEIQNYLSRVVDHFGLRDRMEFDTSVEKCAWNDEKQKWIVHTKRAEISTVNREFDVLINAAGILNHYQYPDIPGLKEFQGVLMHTADWDPSVDLRGKRVGIIGAGASAIQVVPQIQGIVKQLSVYIRTPSWITKLPDTFENYDLTKANESEEDYLQRCKAYESYYNTLFPIFRKGSVTQNNIRQELMTFMESRIADAALREKLIPSYEVGCRRISPGEPFLHALQKPNVKCVFNPIISCEPEGLKTHEGVEELDVLIAATGFNTSFRPRFPLVGRNDVDMRDLWSDDPASYMGLGCADFPNYLSMLGPNCPVANGSLIGSLEATADFIVRLLTRVDKFGAATFTPDKGAQDDFNQLVQDFMVDAVWTGRCTSWYKQGYNGKVTAIWPGSSLHYREMLEQDRWEDWHWTYPAGRYKAWSTGQSTIEKKGGDHSHYLQHGPLLPECSHDSGIDVEYSNGGNVRDNNDVNDTNGLYVA